MIEFEVAFIATMTIIISISIIEKIGGSVINVMIIIPVIAVSLNFLIIINITIIIMI